VTYTIPPGNPLYPCTYVRVYAATPDTVTYGYTAGYTMGYVSGGVVVYGTGWYYPPYIYPGPIPIYYPYPYSYAGAAYYNPATVAWARGGVIYGPYGGVVKGGTAYNPQTGAWAHGGAVYGPYGGAGAISAYNPTTGGYVPATPCGDKRRVGQCELVQPAHRRVRQHGAGSNAYGRWGSGVRGSNQTVTPKAKAARAAPRGRSHRAPARRAPARGRAATMRVW
jgi:hypothetical protein